MSDVAEERVLVFPGDLFDRLGRFQGLSTDVDRYLPVITAEANTCYRPRGVTETDPSFKQLIPYVIFRHGADVFRYVRGQGQGEKRLHAKMSIGIGGHIAAHDAATAAQAYQEGLRRELDEEVAVDTDYQTACVGLINDDSNPVGSVHFGVVYIYDVARPAVSPREKDILEARFVPIAELPERLDEYETWSQICIRNLFV